MTIDWLFIWTFCEFIFWFFVAIWLVVLCVVLIKKLSRF